MKALELIVKPAAVGVHVAVKVVPGASRSRLAGVLGDRLKVQVAAPPEAGKANAAVAALLAEVLGVPPRAVSVAQGQTQPRKVLAVAGMDVETARRRFAAALGGA